MPRVPGIERYEFTCSKCGKVVTTGISQLSAEHIANCPHCGTRFGNTMAGDSASRMDDLRDRTRGVGGGRGGLATPGAGEHVPGLTNPPRNAPAPPIGGNPAIPGPADSGFGFSTSNSPVSGPPTTSARSRGSLIVLIIFVVGGLLLLLALAGIGLIIWMVRTAPSMSGGERVVKRRRPASTRYDPI